MPEQVRGRTAAVCSLLFVLAWSLSLAYLAATGSSIRTPLISMAVVGIALPALAIVLTRKSDPPMIPVERPARELAGVLIFLVLYAFYFLGWAIGAVRDATHPGPERDVALLILRLGISVSAPAVLLYLLGAQVRPLFDLGLRRKGVWPTLAVLGPILVVLVVLASGSPKAAQAQALPAATLLWAAPLGFVWTVFDTGFTEEFLYRAVVQTRLRAVLESRVGAVAISALLFALAHVPGIFLRGGPGTPGWSSDLARVVAYAIAVMAPLGLLYGTLWTRTRSLALVVLAHACVSALPRIADMAATWG